MTTLPNEKLEALRHAMNSASSLCTAEGGEVEVKSAIHKQLFSQLESVLCSHMGSRVAEYIKDCKAVISDIEGTTTPIPFVTTVLFPFAERRFESYVRENLDTLRPLIDSLRQHAKKDTAADPPVTSPQIRDTQDADELVSDVVANLMFNSKANRKVTPMKELQGMIWKEGYASGELKSDVFSDVPKAFEQWKAQGKLVYIYSSGSVAAQKLLFGGAPEGSLLGYLDGHFDTTTGLKQETKSYTAIAREIGLPPTECLFLTDIVGEAVAAREAGMKALLLHRPQNNLYSPEDQLRASTFLQIRDFSCIFPHNKPSNPQPRKDVQEEPLAKKRAI